VPLYTRSAHEKRHRRCAHALLLNPGKKYTLKDDMPDVMITITSDVPSSVAGGAALNFIWCIPEVDLVIDVVASIRIRWDRGRVVRSTLLVSIGEQEVARVGRDNIVGTSQGGTTNDGVENTQCP
jgi:hypothetical protein